MSCWPGSSGKTREDGPAGIPIRGLRGDLPVSFADGGAVPGDRIVGILTPGQGITIYPIHAEALKAFDEEPERWIDVTWDIDEDNPQRFPAKLTVTVMNEPGSLAQVASVIGEAGSIGQANYAASKSGLFGLTMSLAQETARKGITVNSVAPGYVSTEMVRAVPEEALNKVIAKIPVGRLGEPDEIARVVEFLADPDSSFITGRIYSANGGQYM